MLLAILNAQEGIKKARIMQMFQTVPNGEILQKGKSKDYCPICGMTLKMFYKTNHIAIDENNITRQFCSIHCLADAIVNDNAKLRDFKVVDLVSLKFIDVKDAFYVVGSDKKGTMTMVSKYAFKFNEDAQRFVKKFGGRVVKFDEAYKMAVNELPKDNEMIAKKRSIIVKHGDKLYNHICKKTDKKFTSIAQAKTYIVESNLCGDIKGKKLQMIAIYLYKR
jgi:nitrous oxide reductase accessory protein NosL